MISLFSLSSDYLMNQILEHTISSFFVIAIAHNAKHNSGSIPKTKKKKKKGACSQQIAVRVRV
jgi:hypothetical protein